MRRWALLLVLGVGVAQPALPALREAGLVYVALEPLAHAFGYSTSGGESDLTVRLPGGTLTVFAGQSDALWTGGEGGELALSAPVLLRGGSLYAPLELTPLFGLEVAGDALVATDGRRFTLALPSGPEAGGQRVALGSGVMGLELAVPGAAGPESLKLLVVDAGLLALLAPQSRAALDGLLEQFGDARPLYFVLSALQDSAWEPQFVLEQAGSRLELRYPFTVSVLRGDPARIAPDAPVVGLILVPGSVNLRAPVTLTWQGQRGEMQFRQ